MRNETVHCLQPNMIGIDVIWFLPAKRLDRSIRRGAGGGGFGTDGRVFAIGFIPDRNDLGAMLGGQNTGSQLRTGLMGKSVSYAKRIFFEGQSLRHRPAISQFRAYSNFGHKESHMLCTVP